MRSDGFKNTMPRILPARACGCGLVLQRLRERQQIEDLPALEIGEVEKAFHAEIFDSASRS